PTYAKAAMQRRENLKRSADELKVQLEDAKGALGEAFEEMKKVELLDERDQMRERAEESAREQAELDAIGMLRNGVRPELGRPSPAKPNSRFRKPRRRPPPPTEFLLFKPRRKPASAAIIGPRAEVSLLPCQRRLKSRGCWRPSPKVTRPRSNVFME